LFDGNGMCLLAATAEDAIMPYAHKALWYNVHCKPPDKFHAIQFHAFGYRAMLIVFAGKTHLPFLHA
jgi:hypothetical protein